MYEEGETAPPARLNGRVRRLISYLENEEG